MRSPNLFDSIAISISYAKMEPYVVNTYQIRQDHISNDLNPKSALLLFFEQTAERDELVRNLLNAAQGLSSL